MADMSFGLWIDSAFRDLDLDILIRRFRDEVALPVDERDKRAATLDALARRGQRLDAVLHSGSLLAEPLSALASEICQHSTGFPNTVGPRSPN